MTNLSFETVSYFLITNVRGLGGPNIKGFYPISTYAIFLGFFVISIAVSGLLVWLRNRKSNALLLPLFLGPLFSNIFFWGTWLIRADNLVFFEGTHRYSVTATIGSSLFLSSLIVILFDKIKKISVRSIRYLLIGLLFSILLPIYLISSKEINATLTDLIDSGYAASDQEEMKNKLLSYSKGSLEQHPELFYFETEAVSQKFYPMSPIFGFEENMHFRNWELVDGCVGVIHDGSILEKSILLKDGVKGFNASSLCIGKAIGVGRPEVFFKPENFHAFQLKGREVIDIKEKVLKRLNF